MTDNTFYSLGDVAKILNVPAHRIVYLLQSGRAAESMRLAGRRVFRIEDVERIAELMNIELMAQVRAKDERRTNVNN